MGAAAIDCEVFDIRAVGGALAIGGEGTHTVGAVAEVGELRSEVGLVAREHFGVCCCWGTRSAFKVDKARLCDGGAAG